MTTPPTDQSLAKEHRKLIRKYNKLSKMYADLAVEHRKCVAHIHHATEKYAKAKDSARQWKDYLEKHGFITKQPSPTAHLEPSREPSPRKTDLKRITSSQTTDGDPNEALSVDAALLCDDHDEPEVISARPVKRRRREAPAAEQRLAKVKLEPVSPSHPIVVCEPDSPALQQRHVNRKEPSDLDAHLEPFRTPRKHRGGRAWSEEASRPPLLQTALSSLSDGDVCGIDGIKVEASAIQDGGRTVQQADPARSTSHDSGRERVLQPRSVNITESPQRASSHRKRRSDLHKYRIISEDGDEQTSQVTSPAAILPAETSNDRRLSNLLRESPVNERQPLTNRHIGDSKSFSRPKPATITTTSKSLQQSAANPPKFRRPPGLEPSPPPVDLNDEPLRSRKPGTLHPSDFKINPNYMGSTFAFADPIRGRDARRCLPGCTRPECCGNEIRKIIEIGGLPSTTDAEALEQHLGPDFATIMGAYGPAERKEMVIQARVAVYANRFGKHKHAFERRSTPPGFWRTDMPTTQEEEADRKEAARLERERVEERYREAIRGGGRWIFRDE